MRSRALSARVLLRIGGAGKNMEVGQIVDEPSGPPSRYCDAIIHRKLSTHRDNLRERSTDQPTGCRVYLRAALRCIRVVFVVVSSFLSLSPAVGLTCVCTPRNDALTNAGIHKRDGSMPSRSANKRALKRETFVQRRGEARSSENV